MTHSNTLTGSGGDPDTVTQYEIDENEAALEVLLNAPHGGLRKQATAAIVEAVALRECEVRENAV